MRPGWTFVLVVGIAMFPTCSAEIDPSRFNSPMDFTSGPEVDVNNWKIWTINSSMQLIPTLTAGIYGDINSTSGIDKGINLTSRIDKGINLTSGTDKGINLTSGIDKGINRTVFICNIV